MGLRPMIADPGGQRGCVRGYIARGRDCALRSLVADDFVDVGIARQDKGWSPARRNVQKCARRVRGRSPWWRESHRSGSQSRRARRYLVLIEPTFRGIRSAGIGGCASRMRDLIDQDALADGLRLELFEQSVEHRVEFVYAGGAVEFGVDDVAREKSMLESVQAGGVFAFGCARAGRFRALARARRAVEAKARAVRCRVMRASRNWGEYCS